jgi:hypothetical protein
MRSYRDEYWQLFKKARIHEGHGIAAPSTFSRSCCVQWSGNPDSMPSIELSLVASTAPAATSTTATLFAWGHWTRFSDSHVAPTVLGAIELLDSIGRFLIR